MTDRNNSPFEALVKSVVQSKDLEELEAALLKLVDIPSRGLVLRLAGKSEDGYQLFKVEKVQLLKVEKLQ